MPNVLIKSYKDGINVVLDKDLPFDELVSEVEEQFFRSSSFFKNAKVAISFEGRDLTTEEESTLVDAIVSHSDLKVLYIIGKDDRYAHTFLKTGENFKDDKEASDARIVRGNIINNECIESKSTIIVIGDVYPGCKIKSNEDIIVMGGLYGEAYAGCDGNSHRFVAAAEMNPEYLQIAEFAYNKKPHKWGFKPKYQMQVAYVSFGNVLCAPISTEIFKNI